MKKQRKIECPVCGAYARDAADLCASARAVPGCQDAQGQGAGSFGSAEAAGPGKRAEGAEGAQAAASVSYRRATPSVELILCEQVGKRARYTCGACGRQATAEGLLCLPREHGKK